MGAREGILYECDECANTELVETDPFLGGRSGMPLMLTYLPRGWYAVVQRGAPEEEARILVACHGHGCLGWLGIREAGGGGPGG